MLGSLHRLLLKLCDPRNSIAVSDHSPRPPKVAAVEKLPSWTRVIKRRPQIDGLSLERHDTQSNHFHNIKSTINQLPNELLAEIFATVCHADSDQFLGDRQRHKKTTPLVLGGVCAHWRKVVQSSPQIWSHLSLCLSTPWARYERQVSLLKEWLSRSGVCPLTINLVFQNEDDWTNMLANELIDLLAQNAFRWKSINFVLPEAWYPLFECIKHNLNQLTTVSTQPLWTDCGLSPSKRKKLTLFEHAPMLNDLHLNGYYLTDVFLRWSQLTRMTLQHVYLDECFYTLPRTPNLTWCRIYTILINDVNRTIVDPERPILLDKLNKFIVYSAPWGDLTKLLSFLSAPRLETFEISALLDDLVFPQLSTVLLRATTESRGASSLTHLTLSELDFLSRPVYETELELKAFLKEMYMLEELEIDVSKKADREKAAFCMTWFIDLLGIQEGKLEEEGKEKGCIGIESDKGVEINEELEMGKTCIVVREAIPPPPQQITATTARPPHNDSHSPYYILPNLQHFTFTGNIIVMRHASSLHEYTNDNDSEIKNVDEDLGSGISSLPPPLHPQCVKDGNVKPSELPRLLLEMLSSRGGFGCDWLDSAHEMEPQEEMGSPLLDEDIVIPVEDANPSSTKDEHSTDSRIYILDDENNVRALPADVFTEPGPSSSAARNSAPFLVKSTHLNLRKSLVSFTLKANLYGSFRSSSTICMKGHASNICQTESSVTADSGNDSECSKRVILVDEYETGTVPSREIKQCLKRLVEEGGMKVQVVLGGDVWV